MTFSNQNNPNTTGNSIADALLGNFASYQEGQLNGTQFARGNQFEFYAQDSWNITRKLHIDYGVRYAYIPWYHFAQNDYDSFNPALFNPAQAPQISRTNGTITSAPGTYNPYNGYMLWGNSFPGTSTTLYPYTTDPKVLALPRLPSGGSPTDWSDIGPRLGIAYDPFGTEKLLSAPDSASSSIGRHLTQSASKAGRESAVPERREFDGWQYRQPSGWNRRSNHAGRLHRLRARAPADPPRDDL